MGFKAATDQEVRALLRAQRVEHRYQACRDEDCDRFPCRIYKEGYRNGYQDGHGDGLAEGYANGFEDGMAACPGPHSGG